jgi:hypothetical protein
MNNPIVFVIELETRCSYCRAILPPGELARFHRRDVLCVACADVDGLLFVTWRDPHVAREAFRTSARRAVVLTRARVPRGVLVEARALARANAGKAAAARPATRKRRGAA